MDAAKTTPLARYASIYAALWRNSIVREMQFKANFVLWIFVELLWFALQLTFIAVLYSQTDHIGDWSQWQVLLLIGTSQTHRPKASIPMGNGPARRYVLHLLRRLRSHVALLCSAL